MSLHWNIKYESLFSVKNEIFCSNWQSRYNWNIVESGDKHYKQTKPSLRNKYLVSHVYDTDSGYAKYQKPVKKAPS
jgi:hypothetical protein